MLNRIATSLIGIAFGLATGFAVMTFLAYGWSHANGVDLVYEEVGR